MNVDIKILGKKNLKRQNKNIDSTTKGNILLPKRVFYRNFYIKMNGKSKLRKSMYF